MVFGFYKFTIGYVLAICRPSIAMLLLCPDQKILRLFLVLFFKISIVYV